MPVCVLSFELFNINWSCIFSLLPAKITFSLPAYPHKISFTVVPNPEERLYIPVSLWEIIADKF